MVFLIIAITMEKYENCHHGKCVNGFFHGGNGKIPPWKSRFSKIPWLIPKKLSMQIMDFKFPMVEANEFDHGKTNSEVFPWTAPEFEAMEKLILELSMVHTGIRGHGKTNSEAFHGPQWNWRPWKLEWSEFPWPV